MNKLDRMPSRMRMRSNKKVKIWKLMEKTMRTKTKYLNNSMKTSKATKKKGRMRKTSWMMNKSTKDRMMLDYMESKLMRNRWNLTKMKVTHNRTKSSNKKKDRSPRKEKKASLYRLMMKETTSSTINLIISERSSFKIRKKMSLKTNKRQICKSKFRN